MIAELNHIGIRTCDMEASIGFYQGQLGGTIVRDAKSTDGLSRFVYVQLATGIVELITTSNPQDQGLAHVAYLTDSMGLDAAYEQLCAHGLQFTVRPKIAGSGDGRLAFFLDPCGVVFELIEREPRPRAVLPRNDRVLAFDHTLIGAGEKAAACADFYTSDMELTAGSDGRFFRGDDALLVSNQPGGLIQLAFKTTDCAALRAQLQGCGIATLNAENGFIALAPSAEQIYFFEG